MLIGYPAAFSLAAVGLFFGFIGIELGLIRAELPRQPDLPAVRHRLERPAARDPVLHLHGRDPRTQRARRGPARFASASCSAACAAASSYAVIIVGAILGAITGTVAASVIAMGVIALPVMMRYGYSRAPRHRRHRGLGHHHAAHPALAGADRAGRPARPLGRRHVCRRDRPEPDPDRCCSASGS